MPNDVNWIFWSSSHGESRLRRVTPDGLHDQAIGPQIIMPGPLDVDAKRDKLYYAQDIDPAVVGRMNYDGTDPEVVVKDLGLVRGFAVAAADGYLFWAAISDWPTGAIQRSDLSGGNVIELVPKLDQPWGIDVDEEGRKIYWCEAGGGGRIARCNFDGTDREAITMSASGAAGLQLDLPAKLMFWRDAGGIIRADLGAGKRERIYKSDSETYYGGFVALDRKGKRVYWSENRAPDSGDAGRIRGCGYDGKDLTTVLIELDTPNGIAFVNAAF